MGEGKLPEMPNSLISELLKKTQAEQRADGKTYGHD